MGNGTFEFELHIGSCTHTDTGGGGLVGTFKPANLDIHSPTFHIWVICRLSFH